MAVVAVLVCRHVCRGLDDILIAAVHCRQELTGVTTFAAVGKTWMPGSHKGCRRFKAICIGVFMTDKAVVGGRNMTGVLADRAYRGVIGVAAMAALATTDIADTRVRKVRRVFEGRRADTDRRSGMAKRAILCRGYVVLSHAGADVSVMTLNAITGDAHMTESRVGEIGRAVVAVFARLVIGRGRDVIG